jgi:hypothetical protein
VGHRGPLQDFYAILKQEQKMWITTKRIMPVYCLDTSQLASGSDAMHGGWEWKREKQKKVVFALNMNETSRNTCIKRRIKDV